MNTRLLPFFVYLIISIILFSCGSINAPEFKSIENVRPGKIGLNESILQLDIVYLNPNKTRIKLKRADGEAWIANNYLGHFTIDTLIAIPAKGEFRLPVKLQVDMTKIIKSSVLAFLNPEVMIKVTGNARVGKGFLFFNYPIKYEGKQNLRELLK